MKEFKAVDGVGQANLKSKMEPIFQSQEAYDSFASEKNHEFTQFLHSLDHGIKKYIPVEGIEIESTSKIVLSKKRKESKSDRVVEYRDPVYDGYYGYNDYVLFLPMWSDMSHNHNVHIHDTEIVTEEGEPIGHIGEDGINAGEAGLFDPDKSLDQGLQESADYLDTSETKYADAAMEESNGSWLDSGGDSSDDSSSVSSCSSCSSCGGD